MLLLLSPAKSLDYTSPLTTDEYTQPRFLDDAAALIGQLRTLDPAAIGSLMDISDKLAVLNCERYHNWHTPFSPANARQAIMAFDGDVYTGLAARSLDSAALAWLQDHVRILSGLYGILRPLDLMQPYRLEMGTRLANARGRDLYAWWRPQLTACLRDEALRSDPPVIINCASEEYSGAVDLTAVGVRVIQPVFRDWKNGQYKIISFFAKQARGLFARHAALSRPASVDALKDFDLGGYVFNAAASSADEWVFLRRSAG